jgi:hypothetical protein
MSSYVLSRCFFCKRPSTVIYRSNGEIELSCACFSVSAKTAGTAKELWNEEQARRKLGHETASLVPVIQ